MVYAVLSRCPVFGGNVASFDASKTKLVPGVKDVVQISNGVAVIADSTWSAMQGRKVLDIKWDEGPNANQSTAAITRMFSELVAKPADKVARKEGDATAALASAGKKMDAVYEAPFQSHAPMEPMNCTAHVRADGCDVWAPTQMQTPSRDLAAQVKPGCDPGVVRFGPTSWQMDHGELLLKSARGQVWRLARLSACARADDECYHRRNPSSQSAETHHSSYPWPN